MSLDPARKHVATVSQDHTIRVWDLDTMQQVFIVNVLRTYTVFILLALKTQLVLYSSSIYYSPRTTLSHYYSFCTTLAIY